MGSRIVSLNIENFKKISAVSIVPGDSNTILVGGKNYAGKTSCLDAIQAALAGKAAMPVKPLREGETSGCIRIDLGDLIVERRFTESGSTLKVMSAQGASFSSPQKLLDEVYCRLSFDPLKFLSMESKDQFRTLVELIGIDITEIDAESKEIYESRTAVNRLLKEAQADVDRIPAIVGEDQLPDVKPDPADLMNRLNEAMRVRDLYKAHDDRIAKLLDSQSSNVATRQTYVDGIAGLDAIWATKAEEFGKKSDADRQTLHDRHKREMEEMVSRHRNEVASQQASVTSGFDSLMQSKQDARDGLQRLLDSTEAELRANSEGIASLESMARQPHEDIDQLRAALTTANTHCTTWDAVVAKRVKENILRKRQAESDSLTRELDVLAERKRKILADAKYPISGLAVSEDGTVLFEGVPFSQSSRAQQIRTSVAIGIAMNPALRVLLIRDGSLLDDDNLSIVREMADAADAQIWIERVGNKDESAIIIEDGHIAGVEPAVVEAPKKKTRKKSVDVAE